MSELWIIEASGKKDSLSAALKKLDRDAKVFATLGHIMKYPDDLSEVGIAADLSEPLRKPKEAEMVEYMLGLAAESEQIVIATDADQEGDVIAWDVHQLLRDGGIKAPISRVALRGVDAESIQHAMATAYEATAEDAAPGRARAIIDRLLGATYSSSHAPVGRVTSGILARLNKKAMPLRRYIIVVPADDGGTPFRTDVLPKNRHQDEVLRKIVAAKLTPVPPSEAIYYQYSAENMGDLIISMSDQAKGYGQKKPVRELSDSMQRLYEGGAMSYPRSASRGYGPSAMKKIQRTLLDMPGNLQKNPHIALSEERRTHDAPHPIGQVSLGSSRHGFISDHSVRVAVAQSVARASHLWPAEIPDKDAMQASLMGAGLTYEDARWVSELNWTRWDGTLPPGTEAWVQAKMVERSPDAALVLLQMEEEVGKPSTWISRADKLVNQNGGLVRPSDDGMALILTDLGKQALEAAPEFMRTTEFSRNIEKFCNEAQGSGPEPWKDIVQAILDAQPRDIRERLVDTMMPVSPERIMVRIPKPTLAPRPEDFD
jgi:DNA topoisomerase-1